jgi:NAD(P)H-flavin reductase
MTRRLFDKASLSSLKVFPLKAAFEGPYAGHHSLDSYGHAVLFAGSSGITHQVPYLRHLIQGFAAGTVATRKIVLVWVIRDSEQLEWVRPWMDKILQMPRRRDILATKIFITRPKNPREIASPSATVQMSPGRPNVKLILEKEVQQQVGAMVVTVCGPGGLADNVRQGVRAIQEDGVVDFIEESFTW